MGATATWTAAAPRPSTDIPAASAGTGTAGPSHREAWARGKSMKSVTFAVPLAVDATASSDADLDDLPVECATIVQADDSESDDVA